MKPLVIDGSAILGILFRDGESAFTLKTLEALRRNPRLYVPSHWWVETANGLLMAERRKRYSQSEITEALEFIQALPVITDEQTAEKCVGETFSLARQYGLTIYDAAYLELALRQKTRLATTDKALARAAAASGVDLLG
ncbi:MAG: type II toxin-antitoxin system VapC family toxin [Methylacidiphilales bacterium]|nr:type II toxin-antitoxin system VapC family toxin [Candidatus Methylacidiphilales bacterium]